MFGKRYLKYCSVVLLAAFWSLLPMALTADDVKAQEAFRAGVEAEEAKDYVDAAEYFAKAESEADAIEMKYQAAGRVAACYRAAGYLGKEFDALEKLIANYPTLINFSEVVDREYAIGDAYFHGYADPAFWSLRFIPWLKDRNRMTEIYEAALKHAPFAPAGATARLRLAVHYLENAQNEKAIELLREVVRCYPKTEAARFAMLELGNAYSQMALNGDGDGKHFDEAMSIFREFREQYPDLSENEWINQCEAQTRNAFAQRLYNIAEFYHRKDMNDSAEVYLLEVLRRFPDTKVAAKSEELLTRIDPTYFPEQVRAEVPQEYPQYEFFRFPQENRQLLLAPANSNGKFLLPVYDLNLPKENE